MMRRVFAALSASGGSKAGMPFEIASTPVIAVQPLAKAWSSTKRPTPASTSASGGGAGTATGKWPVIARPAATASSTTTLTMKT